MNWRSYYEALSASELEEKRNSLADKFLTPFEYLMGGGTPRVTKQLSQRGERADDYHIPQSILEEGPGNIEEANYIREKLGFCTTSAFSLGLVHNPILGNRNLDISQFLTVSLEPLDPSTGETVKDPRILGVWSKETRTITQIPGRDLNREYYALLKIWNPDLFHYVRDGKSILENETGEEPEKE